MAASYCAHCGGQVPLGAVFCPSCGAPVAAPASGAFPTPLPPAPPAPPSGMAGFPPPGWGGTSTLKASQERPWDQRALRPLRIAFLLGLLGAVASLVGASLPSVTGLFAVAQPSGNATISTTMLGVLGALVVVAVVFGLIEILLFRSGFRTLSEVASEFSTPSTLALFAFFGVILVVAAFGLLFVALWQAIGCVGGGNPLTGACLFTGTFWAAAGLLVVGALILLIGYVGILIGIWRLGTRYANPLFKVGAVLLIIPYVSVVGSILLLVGASQELGRG